MKEKFDYESIQDKPKLERRKSVVEAGLIDERRFLLPPDPIIRERLRALRNVVEIFKSEHPEVVSFGLFGSNTKGYATRESDPDGALYVDLRESIAQYQKNHHRESIKEMMNEIRNELTVKFKILLLQETTLKPKQIKKDLVVRFVDERSTRATLRAEKMDDSAIKDLFALFLLQVGSGIERYRRVVFDELEQQGALGEEKWHIISHRLAEFENTTFGDNGATERTTARREHLYPQNLKDARRVFLKEKKDEQETEEELSAAA